MRLSLLSETFHISRKFCNTRANGAKHRSGRKTGVRVTNRALAKSKVESSKIKEGDECGHDVIFTDVKIMADYCGGLFW